jgi:hypothetical protein
LCDSWYSTNPSATFGSQLVPLLLLVVN